MILSVHIADLGVRSVPGVLRGCPRPGDTPGLRSAHTTFTGAIAAGPPRLHPGRAALIATWEDDAALDGFLAESPLARRLADGWQVRLQPVRVSGRWSPMPVEAEPGAALDDEDGPVAVLTLGQLRWRRALPFLRANSRAAGRAEADPTLIASLALARPPRFVGTFSLWRSVSAMRRYAYGSARPEHRAVVDAHQAKPFHHEAAFVRCRPYAARGTWDGREPLPAAAATVPCIRAEQPRARPGASDTPRLPG
ncbi:spheroidene monooxygenase [Streptomyces sp. NPDC048506]|uniref:spheroidene monooxygenase n=1 Tax=Streptomyces sp. NPDC048506 TaxID=3155028 RepID=UPI0034441ECF